jgi:hypothetical protein
MVGIVRPLFSFISVVYFRNYRSVIVLKRRQETPRLLRDGGRYSAISLPLAGAKC